MTGQPLITLDKISVRLYDTLYLQNITWQINTDEQWAIVGPNGSGKTTLAKALFGEVPVVRGSVIHHLPPASKNVPFKGKHPVGYVSPELFREVFEREELEAGFRDFSGRIHEITTAREVIVRGVKKGDFSEEEIESRLHRLADKMGIGTVLDRDVCGLSTGELCKILIVKSLMNNPELLILDEPFNGLDDSSRKVFAENLDRLILSGVNVVLITHRFEEILPRITHILYVKSGKILAAGNKEDVLRFAAKKNGGKKEPGSLFPAGKTLSSSPAAEGIGEYEDSPPGKGDILIDMRDVTVRYDNTVVLDAFNWRVKDGENWAILGDNGAGKSTVLKVILGDNLQSYSNDVTIFGRKKGDGVSIWEIKRRIGVVSAEFQAKYRKDIQAFDVVCSGFHDSIGLYRSCGEAQKKTAMQWMTTLGIQELGGKSFERLSYGQRKLTLIARAMVKSPLLLFLDEPCDGLDRANRYKVLEIIEYIGRHTHTNLVYVTHHEDEMLPCITHRLILRDGKIKKAAAIVSGWRDVHQVTRRSADKP